MGSSAAYRPAHASASGSLDLDLDGLQMEGSIRGQDSPRTLMIRANMKKVSLPTWWIVKRFQHRLGACDDSLCLQADLFVRSAFNMHDLCTNVVMHCTALEQGLYRAQLLH